MNAKGDELLTRAVSGDRAALAELLERHGPTARASLAGRIPKRWQAQLSEDDLIQQTYADAVAHITEIVGPSENAFACWLKTTARRNLRDVVKMLETHKRGGDRRQLSSLAADGSYVALLETLTGSGTPPSGKVAEREAAMLLRQAIAQLPELYARVVTLHDLEQRPVEEVAAALKRSPGAVYMLRARAHDRLRKILGRASDFLDGSA